MICFLLLLTLGIKMNFNFLFILTMLAIAIQFFYQIKIFEDKIPQSCLRAFKSNNYMGFLIFLNILTLNFPNYKMKNKEAFKRLLKNNVKNILTSLL